MFYTHDLNEAALACCTTTFSSSSSVLAAGHAECKKLQAIVVLGMAWAKQRIMVHMLHVTLLNSSVRRESSVSAHVIRVCEVTG